MARSHETTLVVDADRSVVLDVLTSDAYNIEQESSQGAIDVRVAYLKRNERELVYEVHATRYARGITGENRKKTENQVTTVTWDLGSRCATWRYQGPHGKRVKVHGETRLEQVEGGTAIHDIMHIDVSIPLVGGKIEQMVIDEMKRGFETYRYVVEKHVRLATG